MSWQRFSLCLSFLGLIPSLSVAQCYEADASNSDIRFDFAIERSLFSGYFTEFEAEYCWQSNAPETGHITVRVNMASARTGNKDLDIGMQDKQALNSARYPIATWQTDAIVKKDNSYRAEGKLTIRGIAQAESGDFALETANGNWLLTGSSKLKRLDYDLGIGEFADTQFIPNLVTVDFDFKLKPVD